mgnify:CR=1 FL=1
MQKLINEAQKYFEEKNYDKALVGFKEAYKNAENQDKKNNISLKIGECYFEMKNNKKALNEFTNVYVFEGKKAFSNEDKKYFEFFKNNVLDSKKRTQLLDCLSTYWFDPDLEVFKRIFEICEINATYKGINAFGYTRRKENLKFLVENGLNPNEDCGEGYPAIIYQLASNYDCIIYLKEQGADLDLAMKYAIKNNHLAGMCNLMKCGAPKGKNLKIAMKLAKENNNLNIIGRLLDLGANPGFINISEVLEKANNCDIITISKLSKIKFSKGLKIITPRMKKTVRKIGERFEFYRDSFSKELIQEASLALEELYKIYGVEPVPRRDINNITKITVKSQTWQEQHEELWQMLVPGQGIASTIQGELIRIVGKVSDEIYRNGGINWENGYQKMLDSIPKYVKKGQFDKNEQIIKLSKEININSDTELELLTQLIVEWILANPDLIKLDNVDYKI